jgi:hypothetical protein
MPTDSELAKELLDGLVETDKRGRLRLKYLKKGGPGELNARLALARLLRSDDGLDPRLRESLAELFDPTPPKWQQRKLEFAFRRRGKKTDPYANLQIFLEVVDAVKSGSVAAAAIADTAQKYRLSEELVNSGRNTATSTSSTLHRVGLRLPLSKRS